MYYMEEKVDFESEVSTLTGADGGQAFSFHPVPLLKCPVPGVHSCCGTKRNNQSVESRLGPP